MSQHPRVIVVAGGAGSLGRAVARRLLADGETVVSLDLAIPDIPSDASTRLHHVVGDVRDEEAWAAVLQAAGEVADGRPIDGLAIMSGGSVFPDSVLTQHDTGWEEVTSTAIDGTWRAMRAVLPHMLEVGTGSIVTISSAARRRPLEGHAAYLAAKGAVEALTQQAAREYAACGVRFNVVAPGPIRSALYDKLDEGTRAAIVAAVPMGRPGEPEDVAAAVSFLLSDEARFITGVVLTVDGGYVIG